MYRKNPDAARRIVQKELLEKRKALILAGEALLLSTIRFDFNIQHPYESLKVALKNLGISQKDVKQAAVNLINDALRTTLVVQFKPHYVAAGSLYLAAKFHDVQLPSEKGKIWWHQFDVAPKQLEDVIHQMKELFLKRKPCFMGSAMKPTPTPTMVDKQPTISFPDPVLRYTYSRKGQSRSTSTPAPLEKHQLISNAFDVNTSRCIPVDSLAHHSYTVSSAINGDHKHIHHSLNRTTMDGTSEKQSSQTAPMEKQHIISTPDPVLGHTHSSRTTLTSNNFDKEASRCMPVDSSAHHDSTVSSAKNGDDKSLRTHMDRSSNRTSMDRRSEKQSPRTAQVEKQHIISTQGSVLRHSHPSRTSQISNDFVREASRCMPVDSFSHRGSTVSSANDGDHKSLRTNIHYRLNRTTTDGRSEKQSSQRAPTEQQHIISTQFPVLEHTHSSKTSPRSNNFDTEASRCMPADSSAHHDSTVISTKNGGNKSLRTHMDRSSNRTSMDRRSEKQSTRTAPVEKQHIRSTPDSVLRRTHPSRTSVVSNNFDKEASRFIPLDSLAHQDSTVSSARSGHHKSLPTHMDRSLNRTASDRRSEKQSPRTVRVGKQHIISSLDSVLRHTHPSRTSLISNNSDRLASRYKPVDSLAHHNSTVSSARNGDHKSLRKHMDHSLNTTAVDGRPEKQSSRVDMKADHVYHVCNGQKDINVARVTGYTTKKRRIQEAGEHPSPVDKSDNWVGKKLRSIVVVGTKEPSWKKQKI